MSELVDAEAAFQCAKKMADRFDRFLQAVESDELLEAAFTTEREIHGSLPPGFPGQLASNFRRVFKARLLAEFRACLRPLPQVKKKKRKCLNWALPPDER